MSEHGTWTRYCYWACRCRICAFAANQYKRKASRLEQTAAKMREENVHNIRKREIARARLAKKADP